MTLIVIAGLFLLFFTLAYISRRRFGTLGLALAAGALLASNLTVWLATQLAYVDFPTGPLNDKVAANIMLTLLPALVLLLSGPSYSKKHQIVIGAAAFAAMALLLILGPLASVLTVDQSTQAVLPVIARYSSAALAVAIVLAVADAWLTHNLPSRDKKSSKK